MFNGKVVTWKATPDGIHIMHVLNRCWLLKTSKYLLTKLPFVGKSLGLGSRIYKVIVLGLIRLVIWLWLGPKKGGIVLAKSIFSKEYEIHLDIFAT